MQAAVWLEDAQRAIGEQLDRVATLVDRVVILAAERDEVVEMKCSTGAMLRAPASNSSFAEGEYLNDSAVGVDDDQYLGLARDD